MKRLSKYFHIVGISLDIVFQAITFTIGVILVFGASYIVGFKYLQGNTLWGNDAYSFYMVVDWINKYYPHVPFWFPLQAGGTSFVGYPQLAAYLVILLSKLSSLDLVQSFRLVGFLSVPLTGVGVIAFVLTRFTDIKPGITRAVLATIAGLFYVTSPLAWTWLVRWGFFAESVSHIFVPWTLLFFDLFLENASKEKIGLGYRLSLFGLVLFWLLGFLTHFFAAVAVTGVMTVLVLTKFVFSIEKKVLFKRLFFRLLLLGIFFASVLSWKLYPYMHYNSQVAKAGFSGYGLSSLQGMSDNTTPLKVMLSLENITDVKDPRFNIQDTAFPLYVWILIIPSLLFGWIVSKKVWGLSLLVGVGTYLTTDVALRLGIEKIPFIGIILSYIFTGRPFLIPMRVIIPAVSVFGAYVVWEILGRFLLFLPKKVKIIYYILVPIKIICVSALSVLTITFFVNKYYFFPEKEKFYVRVGRFYENFDLRDIWNKIPFETKKLCGIDELKDECQLYYKPLNEQLKLNNWPKIEISSDISGEIDPVKKMLSYLPDNKTYRFDLSGFRGRQIMVAPIVTNNSMIQIYINTLDLMYSLHNYLSQVLYTTYPIYQNPGVLTELGKWFGLDYVFLVNDPSEPTSLWESDENWTEIDGGWQEFTKSEGLYVWSSKPTVLVISDNEKRIYDQTFRFFTQGGLNYDQAMVIQGPKTIDSLSQSEINKYDFIFMRGYDYIIKQFSYSKIDKYLKNGGVIIFDTGWQYSVPDWEVKNAPDWMPFESLSWKKLPTDLNWSEENFAPLTWEDTSWGVSVPDKLKSWAKAEVTYGETPLVVSGNYGKGKVIWFGFNIVAHAEAKDNQEETTYFNKVISDLVSGKQIENIPIEYKRISPDQIEFKFTQKTNSPTGLFFKESYYPDWKAKLITNKNKRNLKINKAGPGMMFIKLDKVDEGDVLSLQIKKPYLQLFFEGISVLGATILIIYVFIPNTFGKIKVPKLVLKMKLHRIKSANEDEEY